MRAIRSRDLHGAIREALASCQPCRAKVVAAHLRARGMQVERETVNRVLYGALAPEVERDSEYRWSLKRSQLLPVAPAAPLEKAESKEVGSPLRQCEADSGSADRTPVRLRTLMRLRAGLPPVEGLDQLSVGYDAAMRTIRTLLAQESWILALGDYGSGKTHFLQVLRQAAHEAGFATCFFCSDSQMNALNHPQRFMTSLLHTLEIPGMPVQGYEHFLSLLVTTDDGCDQLAAAVETHAIGSRMPFGDARWHLEALREGRRQEAPPARQSFDHRVRKLVDDLSGRTIAARSAVPINREIAYRLLLIARDIVMSRGCSGIVLLIDEAESIFTKLPTIRSRIGAARVLSALCLSSTLEHFKTAIAMTPDGYRNLFDEIGDYPTRDCIHGREPLAAFRKDVLDQSHLLFDCQCSGFRELSSILDRIRTLYKRTYAPCLDSDGEWRRFTHKITSTGLPMRLLVRQAVDWLDATRFKAYEKKNV